MSEHTPGPWEILGPWPSINIGVCIDGGMWSGDMIEEPQYMPICNVYESHDYKTEASREQQCNARLIAAAPELLKIAIAYREECRPAEDVLAENALNGNNEIAAWWRQVDRVIARAEGAIE